MQARVIHVYYRDRGTVTGTLESMAARARARLADLMEPGLSREAPWRAAQRRCKRIVAPFTHDSASAAGDCKGVHVPRQGSLQMNAAIVDLPQPVRSVSQPMCRFLH